VDPKKLDLRKIDVRVIVPVIVLALLAAGAWTFLWGGKELKTLTAHFPRTVSIYEGSDVRVLGVPIGTVDSVTPSGTDVVVKMSYDAEVEVPEEAAAVIVSPSIVGDRFVQLTPVYTDGPVLADGATLETDRTAVPLELDQIYESLDDLTVALGPNGANADGALTDLLETTAENFGGQGAKFHQTIEDFSELTGTLDDNKEELFGSAEALEGFIRTLAKNDGTVRQFNRSLATVSEMLAGERDELAASLRNLAVAMKQVSGFVRENREILGSNIKGLNRVAKVLVKQRAALDEVLSAAPVALNNLALTYNPQAGTLDTRANLQMIGDQITSDPAVFLCGIVNQADKPGQACNLIKDILGDLPAAPRVAALGQTGGQQRGPDQYDPTLGGLVATR
jgi:phospholipid/cholesterol/gamma-HCH transport system substrate-binding protein